MMKRMMLLTVMVAVATLWGPDAFGQTQTVLTDVWKDKDHRGAANRVMVFWIVQVPQNRLIAENEFVRQLKGRGLSALPAYVVIEPDRLVDRATAVAKIKELGMDALLTLRVTNKQTAQSTIPEPGSSPLSPLASYYQYIYDEPTVDASGAAYLETVLFDVKTERRIWAARSVTKVDVVDHKALADFISLMIDRLAADRMIP